MSGDRQDQRVGEGATAIQAGNDVHIHQGVSATQIAEILQVNMQMIEQYRLEARDEVKRRLGDFEDKMQKQFADHQSSNSESFKDPDFQYVVHEAQKAYVRTADEDVGETLVKLLAQRSLIKDRNISSLVLNEAIEVAGKVAKPELSMLSLAFMLYYVQYQITDPNLILGALSRSINKFIDDISLGDSSYGYLAGLGCLTIENFVSREIPQVLTAMYSGAFNAGFNVNELKAALDGDADAVQLAFKELIGANGIFSSLFTLANPGASLSPTEIMNVRYKFRFPNAAALSAEIERLNIKKWEANILGLQANNAWPSGQIVDELKMVVPKFDKLEHIFDKTNFKKITLTAKGIALAHSNARQALSDFSGPLSIWIN